MSPDICGVCGSGITNSNYQRHRESCGGFPEEFQDEIDELDGLEPDYTYKTPDISVKGRKTVYGYKIEAPSMKEARAQIPGDFLVVWSTSSGDLHTIDIVRTF